MSPEAARPPLQAPTLERLRSVLRTTPQGRADRSLAELRAATRPALDPSQRDHALALFRWLNRWGCRIPGTLAPVFVEEIGSWWHTAQPRLPSPREHLADLSDLQVAGIADVARDLAELSLASPDAARRRRLRWTAAAKILYATRPFAVTAWDAAISQASGGQSRESFERHLRTARTWARELDAEAAGGNIESIAAYVGRPDSSVAKLLDEWLYLTLTRGVT